MFFDKFIDTKRKRYCLFLSFSLLIICLLNLFDLYLGITLLGIEDSTSLFSLLESYILSKHFLVQYVFVMIKIATVSLSYIFSFLNILCFFPYTLYLFNYITVYCMLDKKYKEGKIHTWIMFDGIVNVFILCFIMVLTFIGIKAGLLSDVLKLIHIIGIVLIVVKVFALIISVICLAYMFKQYREALQYDVIEEIKELSGDETR